jgi:hypothetical protein
MGPMTRFAVLAEASLGADPPCAGASRYRTTFPFEQQWVRKPDHSLRIVPASHGFSSSRATQIGELRRSPLTP